MLVSAEGLGAWMVSCVPSTAARWTMPSTCAASSKTDVSSRTSPSMEVTASRSYSSRERSISLLMRPRWSKAITWWPRLTSFSITWEAMKPWPPVTATFIFFKSPNSLQHPAGEADEGDQQKGEHDAEEDQGYEAGDPVGERLGLHCGHAPFSASKAAEGTPVEVLVRVTDNEAGETLSGTPKMYTWSVLIPGWMLSLEGHAIPCV